MNPKGIGFLLRQQAEAEEVASYLERLARLVREGSVLGIRIEWLGGKEEIESQVLTSKPIDHINLNLEITDKEAQ